MLIGLQVEAHLAVRATVVTGLNVVQPEWEWVVPESLRFLSHKDENGNIF
jgi:hypothetical protein